MTRAVFSPRAQADIADIWDYTVERWGIAQAERYVRLLEATISDLSASPKRGRACDEIRRGYRKYPAGSHVVFYKISGVDIDIIRILHQRIDIDSHL